MSTKNQQFKNKGASGNSQLNIDGWVPIFASGKQTSSERITNTFTDADLDEMVSTFNPDEPPPIVIGHPEESAPAYGWGAEFRRVGDQLQAKFKLIADNFRESFDKGEYRNRSISLIKGPDGYRVEHIGFLGAALPAVSGLGTFTASSDVKRQVYTSDIDSFTPRVVGRVFRAIREFIIDRFDRETADQVVSQFDVEQISDHANNQTRRRIESDTESNNALNNQFKKGKQAMPITQEESDKLIADARADEQLKFNKKLKLENNKRRRLEFSQQLQPLVDSGALAISDMERAIEVMLLLPEGQTTFSRTVKDGEPEEVEFSSVDWVMSFAQRTKAPKSWLSAQAGDDTDPDDDKAKRSSFSVDKGESISPERAKFHAKVQAYMRENKGVDYATAAIEVEQTEASV